VIPVTKETYDESKYTTRPIKTQHEASYPNLYKNYINLLKKNALKNSLNKLLETLSLDLVDYLSNEITNKTKVATEDYKKRVHDIVERPIGSNKKVRSDSLFL